jgi:hypothetical protein
MVIGKYDIVGNTYEWNNMKAQGCYLLGAQIFV